MSPGDDRFARLQSRIREVVHEGGTTHQAQQSRLHRSRGGIGNALSSIRTRSTHSLWLVKPERHIGKIADGLADLALALRRCAENHHIHRSLASPNLNGLAEIGSDAMQSFQNTNLIRNSDKRGANRIWVIRQWRYRSLELGRGFRNLNPLAVPELEALFDGAQVRGTNHDTDFTQAAFRRAGCDSIKAAIASRRV